LLCPVGASPMTALPVLARQLHIEARNEVGGTVMSLPSPSGQYRAEVKNEICESKNRFDTIVWLTDGSSVNLGGNTWSAFIAPATQNVASGSYSPLQRQLCRLYDSELQIWYPAGTDLRSSAETHNGVRVIYHERSVP
jgi:hypothetical protein